MAMKNKHKHGVSGPDNPGGMAMPKGANRTPTLQPGDPAPDFTLKSHLETEVQLADLLDSNVLLAFYPFDWSPV
jgi:hypothetical protein